MINGTFAGVDGGALAADAVHGAQASVATEINMVELGTGPLGPQPFAVSDGGDLAATGLADETPPGAFLLGGGGDTAAVAHRATHFGPLILHGGGALAGTGAQRAVFILSPAEIITEGTSLLLGIAAPPAPAPLLLTLLDDVLPVAPGSLTASVVNGTPGGDCELSIIGIGVVLTVPFDDSGMVGGVSVPIDVPTSNSYDLVATDVTTGLTATDSFTVVAVTTPQTIGVPVTTPPVNVQPSVGVRKWVFQDPVTSEVYHFAINPSTMNSPLAPKRINFAATTAIDGQKIAFEGMSSPVDWQFEGVLFTQAQYDVFRFWTGKRNRIWITDHFGRAFLCYITSFEPVPRRDVQHPWCHNWTMHALIFEGPVSPT